MITISSVCAIVPGLTEADLRLWLEQDFVRPERRGGELSFREIDVARVRLIRELRADLEVEAPTLPLVLSLLDQLYATRRQLRLVLDALDNPTRQSLADSLSSVIVEQPKE
jgi:chaperone modulatory protein CbpM